MKSDDVTSQFLTVIYNFLEWLGRLEAKDYTTFLPMAIALLGMS